MMFSFLSQCNFIGNKIKNIRFLSIGHLKQKGFVRIEGPATQDFLQGLVTNDVRSIVQPNSFMYTMFLNAKGRILTDSFIYHVKIDSSDDFTYLVEADQTYLSQLMKHLLRYNLRKKVKISIDNSLCLWVAMSKTNKSKLLNEPQAWFPVNLSNPGSEKQLIFYASDPRAVPGWCGRIILKAGTQIHDIFPACDEKLFNLINYHTVRWELGLPEGINELISEETLPLETNADLCGGISFSKGCYIGQELTARNHFTGVVRKRYIPLKLEILEKHFNFTNVDLHKALYNAPIFHSNNHNDDNSSNVHNATSSKPVGWIRAVNNNSNLESNLKYDGLGLIHLSDAHPESGHLIVSYSSNNNSQKINFKVQPYIPFWWPSNIGSHIPKLNCSLFT